MPSNEINQNIGERALGLEVYLVLIETLWIVQHWTTHLHFWFLCSWVCKAGVIIAVLYTSYGCYKNQIRRCVKELCSYTMLFRCLSLVWIASSLSSVSFLWTKTVSWGHELCIKSWTNEWREVILPLWFSMRLFILHFFQNDNM